MNPNDDLMRAIGRIEGKIDGLLQSRDKAEEDHTVLSGRVSTLEAFRSRAYGAGGGIALLVSALWAVFVFFNPFAKG